MTKMITESVELPYGEPYSVMPVLRALAAHAQPGLERPDPDGLGHTRILSTDHGPVVASVRLDRPGVVDVTLRSDGRIDHAEVLTRLRTWLDLDTDPEEVDTCLAEVPLLAPMIKERPGLRVLGSVSGFETAVGTVIGQQVSLAAGRTFGGRLIAAYGGAELEGFRAFPDAVTLAGRSPDDLRSAVGLTGARARTLHGLAVAVADGLNLDAPEDLAETRRTLLALFGIGPWTVDYLSVRAFGDRDACPVGDLILRRALGVSSEKEATRLAEAWRPWRAYAVTHLWTREAFA